MRLNFTLLIVRWLLLAACCACSAFAASVPACNPGLLTRRGNQVNMSLSKLSEHFNQRLQSARSDFRNRTLTAEGPT